MAAVTNLTNLTNTGNFYELVNYTNNSTEGSLLIMFIVSLFIIILLLSMRRYEFIESLLASSFFCTMFSVFFVAADLLDFVFMLIFAIVMSFSALYLYMVKR